MRSKDWPGVTHENSQYHKFICLSSSSAVVAVAEWKRAVHTDCVCYDDVYLSSTSCYLHYISWWISIENLVCCDVAVAWYGLQIISLQYSLSVSGKHFQERGSEVTLKSKVVKRWNKSKSSTGSGGSSSTNSSITSTFAVCFNEATATVTTVTTNAADNFTIV